MGHLTYGYATPVALAFLVSGAVMLGVYSGDARTVQFATQSVAYDASTVDAFTLLNDTTNASQHALAGWPLVASVLPFAGLILYSWLRDRKTEVVETELIVYVQWASMLIFAAFVPMIARVNGAVTLANGMASSTNLVGLVAGGFTLDMYRRMVNRTIMAGNEKVAESASIRGSLMRGRIVGFLIPALMALSVIWSGITFILTMYWSGANSSTHLDGYVWGLTALMTASVAIVVAYALYDFARVIFVATHPINTEEKSRLDEVDRVLPMLHTTYTAASVVVIAFLLLQTTNY